MKKTFISCLMYIASLTYSNAQNTIYSYVQSTESDAENFSIPTAIIKRLGYSMYLNLPDFSYIFLLPTNGALQNIVDPVSFATTKQEMWEIQNAENNRFSANIYRCERDAETGKFNKSNEVVNVLSNQPLNSSNSIYSEYSNSVNNRITFLFKNCIIPEPYQTNKKYYKTFANSFVRIENEGNTVYGPFQDNIKQPINAKNVNMSENGMCIALPEVPMTSYNTVAATLAKHSEFHEFLSILQNCGAITTRNYPDNLFAASNDYMLSNLFNIKLKGSIGAEYTKSKYKTTYLLNNYNYTIYVPTNEAMEKAFQMGLPTINDYDEAMIWDEENGIDSTEGRAAQIREVWLDFVKYHIQDNSIFVDNGFVSGQYKTAKNKLIEATSYNEATGTYSNTGYYRVGPPYKLDIQVSTSGITVTDAIGNSHKVITNNGIHNLMANEYWIKSSNPITSPSSCNIDNYSFVVIHAIDGPLVYSKDQFTYKLLPLYSE